MGGSGAASVRRAIVPGPYAVVRLVPPGRARHPASLSLARDGHGVRMSRSGRAFRRAPPRRMLSATANGSPRG